MATAFTGAIHMPLCNLPQNPHMVVCLDSGCLEVYCILSLNMCVEQSEMPPGVVCTSVMTGIPL